MNNEFLRSLLLKIEIPLEIVIGLVIITGGIYLVFVIIESISENTHESGQKKHSKTEQERHFKDAQEKYLKNIEDSIYALAAAMVRADGKIENEELIVAETIGKQFFDSFNPDHFRAIVNEKHLIKNPTKVAQEIGTKLPIEWKKNVLLYLQQIALADGEIHNLERRLLKTIAHQWGMKVPKDPTGYTIDFKEIIYSLAASVIIADEVIEENEIQIATRIGEQLIENFNSDELNRICHNPNEIPKPNKLALLVKEHLTEDGKETILHYLLAIASSSDNENEAGWQAVLLIAKEWNIDIPL